MRVLRSLLAAVMALAILLAAPAASLAECLRCPPDCPMHAVRDDGDVEAAKGDAPGHAGVEHAHHRASPGNDGRDAGHAAHAAGDARDGDCHRAPARDREQGPCLSGVCGHMDPSLAVALPPGVMPLAGTLVPSRVVAPSPRGIERAPRSRSAEPPTKPPRFLLA